LRRNGGTPRSPPLSGGRRSPSSPKTSAPATNAGAQTSPGRKSSAMQETHVPARSEHTNDVGDASSTDRDDNTKHNDNIYVDDDDDDDSATVEDDPGEEREQGRRQRRRREQSQLRKQHTDAQQTK
jgi:hypothetical protein